MISKKVTFQVQPGYCAYGFLCPVLIVFHSNFTRNHRIDQSRPFPQCYN